MAPFKLDVALPFVRFPAASRLNIPADTLDPTPTMVPLVLNPYVPAARASEHAESAACAVAAMLIANVAAKTITSVVGAMWRFIVVLRFGFYPVGVHKVVRKR